MGTRRWGPHLCWGRAGNQLRQALMNLIKLVPMVTQTAYLQQVKPQELGSRCPRGGMPRPQAYKVASECSGWIKATKHMLRPRIPTSRNGRQRVAFLWMVKVLLITLEWTDGKANAKDWYCCLLNPNTSEIHNLAKSLIWTLGSWSGKSRILPTGTVTSRGSGDLNKYIHK